MLLTLLLIAITTVVALGTDLYLACVARWCCMTSTPTHLAILTTGHRSVRLNAHGLVPTLKSHEAEDLTASGIALPREPGT